MAWRARALDGTTNLRWLNIESEAKGYFLLFEAYFSDVQVHAAATSVSLENRYSGYKMERQAYVEAFKTNHKT